MSGAKEAAKVGATHIISIDADGQHDPADIPSFLAVIDENPLALLVGCRDFATENVPFSSRFGRTFSNFWFKVQTGEVLSDMQCGFRAYPLVVFERVACSETRYSFEIEILVRGVWAGFSVRDVPIRVYYPPREERISHFAAFWDNVRISWLNTRLTIRAIMPMPHRTYAVDKTGHISVLNPLQSLRILLIHNETPSKLACSAFLGVFLGTLPLYGMHSIR
ncbi:hypothetical protein FACS1894168_1060 [Deltaproteobacteria bacterium]|nr:hypothetical protein FACS1894168_1060 [Deltaproteobacteria bacterium]